jgi:hypothetical protein
MGVTITHSPSRSIVRFIATRHKETGVNRPHKDRLFLSKLTGVRRHLYVTFPNFNFHCARQNRSNYKPPTLSGALVRL